jgi:hypothetical protein
MRIGNPEWLEGVAGYMSVSAIQDSDGVVWLVPRRGAHLEASIEMIAAKLRVSKLVATEAILSEEVIDLGTPGYLHVADKRFEAKDG